MFNPRRSLLVFLLAMSPCLLGASKQGLTAVTSCSTGVTAQDRQVYADLVEKLYGKIESQVLDNGMTVIVVPQSHTNKVVVNMVYDVGNMHEQPHEYGMAHLVEHMIFKGTKKMREGDLEKICKHLGLDRGTSSYNAATGPDCTAYYFSTDAANWRHFVDIVADCAQNMDWDSEVLDSELGAIFQEIKLRKRDQIGDFRDVMHNWLPDNHTYIHRGIGYKEQLLKFSREDVLAFYKKYYTPDRAIMMVVGNVAPADVFGYVRTAFADFQGEGPVDSTTPEPFYSNLALTNRVVYQTQQQHEYNYFWQGPAAKTVDNAALGYVLQALNTRMRQEWVDAKGWCLAAGVGNMTLKTSGLIYASVIPKPDHVDVAYDQFLNDMIEDIIENGITKEEYAAAHKYFMRLLIDAAEQPEKLSNIFSFSFFPEYSLEKARQSDLFINNVSQDLIRQVTYQYMRGFLRHEIKRVPLPESEQGTWIALQQRADLHEKALLDERARQIVPSDAEHSDTAGLPERHELLWPDAPEPEETFTLTNGMKVHYLYNATSPMIFCSLALHDAEATDLAWGVKRKKFAAEVWPEMVLHGTAGMSKKKFDDILDGLGAGCSATRAGIVLSSLKQGFDKSCEVLSTVLCQPALPTDILIRKQKEFAQEAEQLKNEPGYRVRQHLRQTMFKQYPWNYPYQQELINVQETTQDDVRAYHDVMTDPTRITATIVGDISLDEARGVMEKHFGPLMATAVIDAAPSVPSLDIKGVDSHIDLANEEVVIRAVRPACPRDHADYPALIVLDSYLNYLTYDVRQRTGLFYAGNYGRQPASLRIPSILMLYALTGPTRVQALVNEFKALLQNFYTTGITAEQLEQLKGAWIHGGAVYVRTSGSQIGHIASCISGGHEWQFEKQMRDAIKALTVEQVNAVISTYFAPETWSFITAGRFNESVLLGDA